jgi:hypothetical protein
MEVAKKSIAQTVQRMLPVRRGCAACSTGSGMGWLGMLDKVCVSGEPAYSL